MEKKELYQKVYINSVADLPKIDNDYIVHSKSFGWIGLVNWKNFESASYPEYNQYLWLFSFDWYLLPVSQPTDEEIEKWVEIEHFNNSYNWKQAFIFGAKALRDGEISSKEEK